MGSPKKPRKKYSTPSHPWQKIRIEEEKELLKEYGLKNKKEKYWPANLQLMAKDILRVHATIWPAILLALGKKLPKTIFVHGFFTVNGQKMSKSLGNVVDPKYLSEKYC